MLLNNLILKDILFCTRTMNQNRKENGQQKLLTVTSTLIFLQIFVRPDFTFLKSKREIVVVMGLSQKLYRTRLEKVTTV